MSPDPTDAIASLHQQLRTVLDQQISSLAQQYEAVFLSIGTWKESWVYLPGTELRGVIPALPFLEAVSRDEPVPVGRKVVVIGGGFTAIDCTRTSVRQRAAEVTLVYRRDLKDMPAQDEVHEAIEEGARVIFQVRRCGS
jgi:NADPH-dependent glutamate synthase beta subunit-like oxidoreductase